MSAKQEFIDAAKSGKILAKQCTKCGDSNLATVYFCRKCGNKKFENVMLDGEGYVETFTIITVPPTGFEKYVPYAWVIMKLNNSDLRISGFMSNISKPDDLPINTKSRVIGFDERGILIQKNNIHINQ
ncbi:MAG: OB-fold domain-containing protein [Nitrosopumilaceae archaeon]|nr:OB-fold domain-containing protein [Nitrosopumilaceae archaeon]